MWHMQMLQGDADEVVSAILASLERSLAYWVSRPINELHVQVHPDLYMQYLYMIRSIYLARSSPSMSCKCFTPFPLMLIYRVAHLALHCLCRVPSLSSSSRACATSCCVM